MAQNRVSRKRIARSNSSTDASCYRRRSSALPGRHGARIRPGSQRKLALGGSRWAHASQCVGVRCEPGRIRGPFSSRGASRWWRDLVDEGAGNAPIGFFGASDNLVFIGQKKPSVAWPISLLTPHPNASALRRQPRVCRATNRPSSRSSKLQVSTRRGGFS